MLPLAGARTNFRDPLPGSPGFDVLGPERPGPALDRPRGIDRAALLGIPEDAVPARVLGQTVTVADLPHEPGGKLVERLAAVSREDLDLLNGDPNVTRRSGAAGAASRTREFQAFLVPGLVGVRFRH